MTGEGRRHGRGIEVTPEGDVYDGEVIPCLPPPPTPHIRVVLTHFGSDLSVV